MVLHLAAGTVIIEKTTQEGLPYGWYEQYTGHSVSGLLRRCGDLWHLHRLLHGPLDGASAQQTHLPFRMHPGQLPEPRRFSALSASPANCFQCFGPDCRRSVLPRRICTGYAEMASVRRLWPESCGYRVLLRRCQQSLQTFLEINRFRPMNRRAEVFMYLGSTVHFLRLCIAINAVCGPAAVSPLPPFFIFPFF